MRLISARVEGFQSFNDSRVIAFSEGINLIIGQNNSGKSAFLRALLPTLPDDRHRTPEKWETHRLPEPKVSFEIETSGSEIEDWILRSGSQNCIPVPSSNNAQMQVQEFFNQPSLIFSLNRRPNSPFRSEYPSHRLYTLDIDQQALCAVVAPRNGELGPIELHANATDTLPNLVWEAWKRNMFHFAAERMTIGEAPAGYANRLTQNASNLPNVLHNLSSEQGDVFARLIEHLREIFSTVGNLSVRTKPDGPLEVRVWPTEAMARVELSFPLNSSGTGVSQVIALLTAIMTLDKAVLIIDEINSFLHPAAVKSLLRILQSQYSHHQYIISTHAPEVIGFSNPRTLHLARRAGYESTIEKLNLDEVSQFREISEHLGVSMADVFAADRVIWVEGPTEELCFPYIYQRMYGPLPKGTVITSVAATGDFNTRRRDPAIVYEVYQRLSAAAATLVVAVAFSFDTEKLKADEVAKMQRDSKGLLHFLPRRHFECYIVDPAAIASLIGSKDPTSAAGITSERVEDELIATASTQPFSIPEWKGNIRDQDWLSKVDAANLIGAVCVSISDSRATFNKKDDSLFLVRHILDNNPGHLAPLGSYVNTLIEVTSK